MGGDDEKGKKAKADGGCTYIRAEATLEGERLHRLLVEDQSQGQSQSHFDFQELGQMGL